MKIMVTKHTRAPLAHIVYVTSLTNSEIKDHDITDWRDDLYAIKMKSKYEKCDVVFIEDGFVVGVYDGFFLSSFQH